MNRRFSILLTLTDITSMQLQAHFHSIQKVIIEHLQTTQNEILVAVAWFTDREIFEVLCQKAQEGVQVSIALLGDHINKAPSGLNFHRLSNLGGNIKFLPSGSDGAPMMHHKFCVLDKSTVITGSYNWVKKPNPTMNITVVTNAPDFATEYGEAFHVLTTDITHDGATSTLQMNTQTIRRRLEMIRNLILLGEQDDLAPHIQKLHPVAEALKLKPLLLSLEQGDYKEALVVIEDYLHENRNLVLREDIDVPNLQFQLKTLELRLQSLSDEKSDLERTLIVFNRRYSDALGSLVIDMLGAQAKLAKKKAENSQRQTAKNQTDKQEAEQDQQEANQAQKNWHDYQHEYENQQVQDAPSQLNEEEVAELKTLYRKACSLCHPDRFEDIEKEAAHQIFVELQNVYKSNDISALRDLHNTLKSGGLPKAPRSSTIRRSDALRTAIAELQHRITSTLRQLQNLYRSEGADLLRLAGSTEDEWLGFFSKQELLLQAEFQRLQNAITHSDANDIN